jgi:CheY-like chemotaxis protein
MPFETNNRPVVHVVDDDASLRGALESLFESVGLATRAYGAASDFLNASVADKPGCIVIDIRLPDVSGLDFQVHLTRMGVRLPVIMMTGYGDIPMTVRAMKRVEHFDRRAAWIGGRLEHERRYGGDQHRLGHTVRSVPGDIASNFSAARGMTDMDGILEIELLNEFREVVGVGVHVVAGPRLARTSVAAAVMGDAAISVRGEIEHLVFERIRGERPAVAEDHRLPGASVFVINLRAVFGCERTHGGSFAVVGRVCRVGVLCRCGHRHHAQACGSGNASAADQKPAPRRRRGHGRRSG